MIEFVQDIRCMFDMKPIAESEVYKTLVSEFGEKEALRWCTEVIDGDIPRDNRERTRLCQRLHRIGGTDLFGIGYKNANRDPQKAPRQAVGE